MCLGLMDVLISREHVGAGEFDVMDWFLLTNLAELNMRVLEVAGSKRVGVDVLTGGRRGWLGQCVRRCRGCRHGRGWPLVVFAQVADATRNVISDLATTVAVRGRPSSIEISSIT